MRARFHPIGWNHVRTVPLAAMEVKQSEAREVSRADVEQIRGEMGIGTGDIAAVVRGEVLHSDRLSNLVVERVENICSRGLFEDVAERVEVPVVVIPEGSVRMRAARRTFVL